LLSLKRRLDRGIGVPCQAALPAIGETHRR
jgi:hypothetical protein